MKKLFTFLCLLALALPGRALTSTNSVTVTNNLGGPLTLSLYSVTAGNYTLGGLQTIATNGSATLTGSGTNWAGALVLNTNNNLAVVVSWNAWASNVFTTSYLLSVGVHQIISIGGAGAPGGITSGGSTTNPPSLNTNTPGVSTNPPSVTQLPVSVLVGTNPPNGRVVAGYGSVYNQFDGTGTNFVQEWIKQTATGSTNWAAVSTGGGVTNLASPTFQATTLTNTATGHAVAISQQAGVLGQGLTVAGEVKATGGFETPGGGFQADPSGNVTALTLNGPLAAPNLTGTINPTNLASSVANPLTLNFAASNNIVDPKALQDLNGYWAFLQKNGLSSPTNGLLDGLALRPRMHSDTGKVTLRGNVFTWANPTYDPNNWGAWINPTSTISLTLPYAISNFTVVVSFRAPYGVGGGNIFRLSDPITYSSFYYGVTAGFNGMWTSENNGTNFYPFVNYQNAISGTNYGTNQFFPPWNYAWSQHTDAPSLNVNKKEGARAIERRVQTFVHMANGTVNVWQDAAPCKFSYFFLTNSYTSLTPSPVGFTRLDIGMDVTNANQTLWSGVGTNFFISSIQIFLTTNVTAATIGAEYGASYWLEDEDYFDVFYGHSRMQPVVNNYGVSWNATNSWPLFYEAEKSGNSYFGYHNQAEGGTSDKDLTQGWQPAGGLNEITYLPFDKIKTVNLFHQFTENDINNNGLTVAQSHSYVTNGLWLLRGIPQIRWNWISSWQFGSNSSGYGFSYANETNEMTLDNFEWTNTVDQVGFAWNFYNIRSGINQFVLNPTNGFGTTFEGIHFETTNTAPNKAIAHYILTREWTLPVLGYGTNVPVIF